MAAVASPRSKRPARLLGAGGATWRNASPAPRGAAVVKGRERHAAADIVENGPARPRSKDRRPGDAAQASFVRWLWDSWFETAHMYSCNAGSALKAYKYRCIDLSPVARHILDPYWRWVCDTLMPRWLAPNLITLAAFGCTLLALVAALPIVIPREFAGPVPAWLSLLGAAAMWAYSTLDNVDGKQARRTGSSSPLGELFDHGCDALNCAVGSLLQAACVGLGRSVNTCALMATAFWAFYLPTWEEFHTGVFVLAHVNGPTEGLILAAGTMAATAFVGSDAWRAPIADPRLLAAVSAVLQAYSRAAVAMGIGKLAVSPGTAPRLIDAAMLVISALSTVLLCVSSFVTVLRHYVWGSGVPASGAVPGRSRTFPWALLQLAVPFVLTAACASWLGSPASSLLPGGLYAASAVRDTLLFVCFWLAFGLAFSSLVSRVIYAHLTRGSFPGALAPGIVPLFVGAAMSRLLPAHVFRAAEPFVVGAWLVAALALHAYFSRHAIASVCGHLRIRCLHIPY